MGIYSASNRRLRRARIALVAALAVGLLALAAAANAEAATINVNPVTGNDSNSGSATSPLKTLTKALSKARAGDTVELAGGGYGPGASGDQFPETGLVVPSGVTIEGATNSGFPVATLLGPGSGVALNLAGNATIRNLGWGAQGFGIGLYAKQGTQTLRNLDITMTPGATANIDGQFGLAGGIVVRGTANATLNAGASGANTTGSTFFVNGGPAVKAFEQAQMKMSGGEIKVIQNEGVEARDQARFTMQGGRIDGAPGANCPGGTGIELLDAAGATLTNSVELRHLDTALNAHGTSKANIVGSSITKDYGTSCVAFQSVRAQDTAALSFDGARVAATGAPDNDVGILTRDRSTLALKNTVVSGHADTGLEIDQETIPQSTTPQVRIDGGGFVGNGFGISQVGPATPIIKVTSASFSHNDVGIEVTSPMLKVRNTTVAFNRVGILVRGTVGAIPGGDVCAGPCVNLGTDRDAFVGLDPGNNTFTGNTETGVDFRFGFGSVFANGNVWKPNTQAANADGIYPQAITVRGPDPLADGTNFRLSTTGTNEIVLGPGATIGTFALTPQTLTASAGRPASWKLTWTHPVSWKRLHQVLLRLESRGKPVGEITINQQTRRVHASGPAVRLVPARSTVTGRGHRLTARLTLRIATRHAGRTLIATVAASDDHGTRQGWRTAGRLRVLGA